MVNFKYYCLPLLVGFLGKALAQCTINENCIVNGCDSTNNGYHLIENSIKGDVIAKYDHNATKDSNKCILYKVPGFYKLTDDSYIECKYGDNNLLDCKEKQNTITSEISCNSEDGVSSEKLYIGKMIKENNKLVLCLGTFGNDRTVKSIKLEADADDVDRMTKGVRYLVQHTLQDKKNVFSFKNTANYYVVIANRDSIIFDETYTKVERCSNINGKLIKRKEDYCNIDESSGKYYDCEVGICKSRNKDSEKIDNNGETYCEISYDISSKKYKVDVTTIPNCRRPDPGYYFYSMDSTPVHAKINPNDNNSYMFADNVKNPLGNYVKISNESTPSIIIIQPSVQPTHVGTTNYYYVNRDVETKDKFMLVRHTITVNKVGEQATRTTKLINNISDETLYEIDSEDSSLIKITRDSNNNIIAVSLVNKLEVVSGYYLNPVSIQSGIACTNGLGCVKISLDPSEVDTYTTKLCNTKYIGSLRLEDGTIKFCTSYNTDTDVPTENDTDGKFIINSTKFPGANGYVLVERSGNTILKVPSGGSCSKDGDIIEKRGNYYFCSNVVTTITTTSTKEKDENGDEKVVSNVTKSSYGDEILFEENGAVFVVKLSDGYYVVSMDVHQVSYSKGGMGTSYYIDRTGRTVTVNVDVSGKSVKIDPEVGSDTIVIACSGGKCDKVETHEKEVFINSEQKYNGNTGSLIICDKEEEIIKCKLDNIYEGFYTNEKGELISCDSTGCKIIDIKENDEIYYVNYEINSKKIKPLIRCYNKKCEKYAPEEKECNKDNCSYQYNYINSGKEMSVLTCTDSVSKDANGSYSHSYSCNEINDIVPYSYFISDEDNDNGGNLIECISGNCVYVNGDDSFINARNSKEIITCKNKTCKLDKSPKNYYIDGSEKGFVLINCSSTCVKKFGIARGTYISGDNKIITYDSTNNKFTENIDEESCTNEMTKISYSLNEGNDKDKKPLIKKTYICKKKSSGGYESETIITTVVAEINKLYKNLNSNKLENAFIICGSTTSCSEVSAENNNNYLDVSNDSNVYYECNSEGCNTNLENFNNIVPDGITVGFLVDSSSMKIVNDNSLTNTKLVSCTGTNNGPTCKFINSSPLMYYINGGSNKKNLIYTYGGNKILTPGNGYYINSNTDVIQCNNRGCNQYSKIEKCDKSNVGGVINQNLCVGETESGSAIEKKAGKYIIKINNSGSFAGDYIGKLILVNYVSNTEEKSILVIEPENEEFYLYDSNNRNTVNGSQTTGVVYGCSKTNYCIDKTPTSKSMYINADSKTASSYPIIYCKDNNGNIECKLDDNKTGEYCLSNGNLYTCTNSCSKVDEESGCLKVVNLRQGYYLPYDNTKLYNCSSNGKCEVEDPNEGYYSIADLSNPLVKCEKSLGEVRCYSASPNDGYYIKYSSKKKTYNLVRCSNKICSETTKNTIKNGYYVSGEGKVGLIKCTNGNCDILRKPNEGWYINASEEAENSGKYLIYCKSNFECSDEKIPNKGYLLNASNGGNSLIDVNSNSPSDDVEISEGDNYYVNASNNQIIYCLKKNNKVTCNNLDIKSKSWFKSKESLISCNKINSSFVCSEYNKDNLGKGYYLNSGIGLPLLLVEDVEVINVAETVKKIVVNPKEADPNSWYINADNTAGNSEKIIACTSKSSCTTKEIKTVECNNKSGEFTNYYGGIVWCNEKNVNKYEKLQGKTGEIVLLDYKSGLIPGITITDNVNKSVFPMKVYENRVIKHKIDGYYYDGSKLYLCKNDFIGNCEEINISSGYYFQYTNPTIWRCENGKCSNGYNKEFNNCENHNVIIDDNKIKLCLKDNGKKDLSEIDLSTVYFLEADKAIKFPGRSLRNVLADVNKYYVKFKEDVNEIENCPQDSDETKPLSYCLKNDGKLYSLANIAKPAQLTGSSYEINKKGENKNIESDYDTNNGYFIYNSKSSLKKVYIDLGKLRKRDNEDNTDNKKYMCVSGDVCVIKPYSEKPVKGYKCSSDGILIKKYGEGEEEVVAENINDGIYLDYDESEKFIVVENNFCKEENTNIIAGLTYDKESGSLSFYIGNVLIKSGPNSKFVFLNNSIYEMSKISFGIYETRNIFLNKDYEVVSNENEEIKYAYECHNGSCNEIKCNSEKYYLNTIQYGQRENAVIKCSNENGSNKFEPITPTNEIIYENAGAEDSLEAVIKCTKEYCITKSTSSFNGIPQCKSVNEENSCVNAETSSSMMEGQHCLYENKIYESGNNSCAIKNVVGTIIFDTTLRELKSEYITENHYGASMYNCIENIGCYRTYGYILNDKTGYTKCDSKQCNYINDNIESDCKVYGPGSIIKENSDIKLCLEDNKSEKISDGKIYPITINSKSAFPEIVSGSQILVSVSENVATVINDDKYILIGNNKIIVSGSGTNLYKCYNNKKCELVSKPEYGYYSSNYVESQIECKADGCTISNVNNKKEFKKGLYEYVESGFPGYDDNISVISVSDGLTIEVFKADNYVLLNEDRTKLADVNETSVNLFTCSSVNGECEVVNNERIYDGWYVSGDTNYKAIICKNKECEVRKTLDKASCQIEGDFIYKNNEYIICVYNPQMTEIKLKSFAGNSYKLTKSNQNFPNGKSYIVVSENSVIGIGVVDQSIGGKTVAGSSFLAVPTCNSVATNKYCTEKDEYCIKDGKIYLSSGEGSSAKCEQQYPIKDKDENVAIVFNGSRIADGQEGNIPAEGSQMYYCDSLECRITSGYYKIVNDIYSCDYIGCTKVSSGSKIGEIKDGKLIYNKSNSGSMNDRSYYFIEGNNKFPSSGKYKSFLVEAGNNYFVIYNGNGYYLIDSGGSMMVEDPYEEDEVKSKRYANENTKIEIAERAGGINTLYYCDSNGCIIPEVYNGYYINAGAEKSNLAIIGCYSGNCELATDINFKSSTCSTGSISRAQTGSNYQNYKFCISNTSSNSVEIKTTTPTKYSILELKKGDKFLGIDLMEEDLNLNIIIKYSNLYIEQYRKTGYLLLSNNDVVLNVSNQKNPLYKCEDTVLFEGSSETVVQCKPVINSGNGMYFNNNLFGDKRYIRCQENLCSIVEATEADECKESGSLIYNNGSHKLCVTEDRQLDISSSSTQKLVVKVSSKDDIPGVNSNGQNILVGLESDRLYYIEMDSYVIVNKKTNSLIEDGTEGVLYRCNGGICIYQEIPNNGWYIKNDDNGLPTQLIYCYVNSSFIKQCSLLTEVNEGFYVGANISKPLIQCILPGKTVEGQFIIENDNSVPLCFERDYKEGWYLNADAATNDYNPLINCSKENGCVVSTVKSSGWYINNAIYPIYINNTISDIQVFPLIQCFSSEKCELFKSKLEKKCTKGGEIIESNNGEYRICKNENESFEFSKSNSIKQQVITINTVNDFPNAGAGYLMVGITKNEVLSLVDNDIKYYYKDSEMYKCQVICEKLIEEGIILYEELTKNLMISSNCNEVNCSWNLYNKQGYVFITDDNKLVTSIENMKTSKMYKCKKNNNNVLICGNMKINNKFPTGYYYNNEIKQGQVTVQTLFSCDNENCEVEKVENLPKCTQVTYKENSCYISYSNEYYTNEYNDGEEPIIESGKLCVNENNKLILVLKDITTGISDNENCVLIHTDNSVKYYAVGNNQDEYDIYSVEKEAVYKINEKYLINSLSNITFAKSKEYNGEIIQGNNLIDQYIMACNNGKCISRKTITCQYDFQTEICKTTSGSLNAGQICQSVNDPNKLYLATTDLNTSGGLCIRYKDISSRISIGNEDTRKIDINHYELINKKMYSINSDDEVTVIGDGIYILDNANYRVDIIDYNKTVDISTSSIFKVYVCNSNGCSKKTKCGNGELNEYMFDEALSTLYQCNPKNNTLKKVEKIEKNIGYYLNNPWNDLIQCYSDFNYNIQCIRKSFKDGMEGYYVDKGNVNEGMMIKCKRENNKFTCIDEKMIECKYNDKDETCESFVDLMRNSYCYFNYEDKISGWIRKLVYIENYIKAGDRKKCIVDDGNEHFFKYSDSKFLGHNERNDLIKFNKNSVISIFENNIGYYIISTTTGMGLLGSDNLSFNKSRMYKCIQQNCEEIIEPKDGVIYINKASKERMIKFDKKNSEWNIIYHRCDVKYSNTKQCLINDEVGINDVVYLTDENNVLFYYKLNNEAVQSNKIYTISNPEGIKNIVEKEAYKLLENNKYQIIKDNSSEYLYIYNENKQSFDIVNDNGYYMFKNDNKYNMDVFGNTKNMTYNNLNDIIKIYEVKDNIISNEEIDIEDREGYILNKADIEKKGSILQIMRVSGKIKPENNEDGTIARKRSIDENKHKIKFINNRCISIRKNICVSSEFGKVITVGSPCVVMEGEYKGIYLAISEITIKSDTINCIKFDSENMKYDNNVENNVVYQYINENPVEFAGENHNKTIILVYENKILSFNSDIDNYDNDGEYNEGYYIIDNDTRKSLNSTIPIEATGYYCGINEINKLYECNQELNPSKYYYSKNSGLVFANNKKWNQEENKKYYIYNKSYKGASIQKIVEGDDVVEEADIVLGGVNIYRTGKYINSMVTDEIIIVSYDGNSDQYQIDTEILYCKVNNDGTCTSESIGDDSLITANKCYNKDTGKLYLVEVKEAENENEESKTLCRTGSEDNVKYYLIGSNLFYMDGNSIQEVDNGYYVLNDSWEEFSSNYPEVPQKIIKCDNYNCEVTSEGIKLNTEVLKSNSGMYKMFTDGKFVNAYKPGFYFFNRDMEVTISEEVPNFEHKYIILEDGSIGYGIYGKVNNYYTVVNENKVAIDYNYNNVYINYAKNGEFIKGDKNYVNSLLTYDSDNDRIVYNGDFNEEDDKNVFKFIEVDNKNSLFKLKKKVLEHAESGLYAIQDGLPFKNKEWTSLKNEKEICYYDSVAGICSRDKLNIYKNQKYMVNKASENMSIIEYDYLNTEWRVVTEDGYYFFFENEYSITESDRRVSKVLQILNGVIIDVTESEKMKGYFVFEGLMVEGTGNGWEDAVPLIGSVTVSGKKKCTSYEIDVSVKSNGFCYNEKMGICGIKNIITNDSKFENNCMFINENNMYYYIIDGNLYVLNKNMYQKINKSGIYVIGNSDTIFNSKIESDAIPYVCKESHCETRRNLASQYYLNMANVNENAPIILEYNNSNKSWKKTNKDGYYFFNVEGYPVTENEEIGYAYLVSENGNKIVNIRSNAEDGSYVSQSSQDDIIVVKNKNWNKASRVAKCSYDDTSKNINSNSILKSGDICLMDNKQMVLIKTKIKENLYEGVVSQENIIYCYIENDKNIIKIENNTASIVEISGYVVIEKDKMIPLSSIKEIDADAYFCNNGVCTLLNINILVSEKLYINEISEEFTLVKYINNGQWKVVNERGYYFLNDEGSIVDKEDVVNKAFLINIDQEDISEYMNVGYYLNKAKNDIVISNNGNYWMKGDNKHKCNITISNEGIICSTMKTDVRYSVGDYCSSLSGDEFYLLTGEATFNSENPNCVNGNNNEPIYIFSNNLNNKLVNETINNRLIEITNDSIKVALPGLYILNSKGNIIRNSEVDEELIIYRCSKVLCVPIDLNTNERVLSITGDIYEIDETGKLVEVIDDGIYFFNEEGIACSSKTDVVDNIVRIKKVNGKPVKTIIKFNELEVGAYVNEADKNSISIYDGQKLIVKKNDCIYKEEEHSCTNDEIELDIGSYCIVEGNLYIITSINENDVKKCIPGSTSSPVFFMNNDHQLMVIKEKSVSYISKEGYYAINENNEALVSDELVKSKFIQCEYGGECNELKPDIGRYVNRAADKLNIVNYPTGEVDNAKTSNTTCSINEENNTCNTSYGELNIGDVCTDYNSIYLIADEGRCVKAEKSVISYQLVNKKLYMLKDDSVIQKMDGYYFVNAEKRAISNKADYAKIGTLGYKCSNKGDCFVMEPTHLNYYPDYSTKAGKKFNVIKFDPSKNKAKGKRQEENEESEKGSGYEYLEEEGVYKLDDGSYAECEMNDNEEISCYEIDSEGTRKTTDGEIIICKEDEEGEIECSQATEGGYYIIDGELMECEPNDNYDKLECKEMDKEGYFLSTPEEVLYECVENDEETSIIEEPTEDANINKLYDELDANGEKSNLEDPEDSCNDEDGCYSSSTFESTTTETISTLKISTTTTEETTNTSTTTIEEVATPTPLDVYCKPVECEIGKIISQAGEDGEVEMYVCRKVNNKNIFVPNDCDSGSYVKDDDYYTCEDEKGYIDENKIEKPSDEHTNSTINTVESTTISDSTITENTKTTTSTTIINETSTSSSSTMPSTTTKKSSTTNEDDKSTKTTTVNDDKTTTTTTTTKKQTATTTAGSGTSLIVKIPSLYFYLIFIIISYYLLI